ncbi:MAG: hypothetical protein ACYTKD_29070, partial [Planctomycetota bacterium]
MTVKRPTPREITFVVAGIAGVAVLFLPFVRGYAPIGVLTDASPVNWQSSILVSVSFLAIPILTSTVRQALVLLQSETYSRPARQGNCYHAGIASLSQPLDTARPRA